MSATSDILFNYLRNIFNFKTQEPIDLEKIDDEYVALAKGLMYFEHGLTEYNEFAKSLARGELDVKLPPTTNEISGPLKSLHASLKHLTWQSQQVAKGDYKQRVDFMGEFADSFNTMIEQLDERRLKLEEEIMLSNKRAEAMEQGNILLSNLMCLIPQQIFVVSTETREVLLFNDTAKYEMEREPQYVVRILEFFPEFGKDGPSSNVEIRFDDEDEERYLSTNSYPIEWEGTDAVAIIISDVSHTKKQMKNLEVHAFFDALTGLHNRFYGMLTLNEWLSEKKMFSLVFIDMDRLKYVNDSYGHDEGDKYIMSVADCLRTVSSQASISRIGGDEFMLLVPGIGLIETDKHMNELQQCLGSAQHTHDRDYVYSISFGIVEIGEDNDLPASIILGMADERMYMHKRSRKMRRRMADSKLGKEAEDPAAQTV